MYRLIGRDNTGGALKVREEEAKGLSEAICCGLQDAKMRRSLWLCRKMLRIGSLCPHWKRGGL